jgi:hypothetical protein
VLGAVACGVHFGGVLDEVVERAGRVLCPVGPLVGPTFDPTSLPTSQHGLPTVASTKIIKPDARTAPPTTNLVNDHPQTPPYPCICIAHGANEITLCGRIPAPVWDAGTLPGSPLCDTVEGCADSIHAAAGSSPPFFSHTVWPDAHIIANQQVNF